MDIQQVDVIRLELLQTRLHRQVHALGAIATKVGEDLSLGRERRRRVDGEVVGGVFGGEDDLVAVVARFHPGADAGFGLFELVVVGGVDEVAALGEEVVEDGGGGFRRAGAHCGVLGGGARGGREGEGAHCSLSRHRRSSCHRGRGGSRGWMQWARGGGIAPGVTGRERVDGHGGGVIGGVPAWGDIVG